MLNLYFALFAVVAGRNRNIRKLWIPMYLWVAIATQSGLLVVVSEQLSVCGLVSLALRLVLHFAVTTPFFRVRRHPIRIQGIQQMRFQDVCVDVIFEDLFHKVYQVLDFTWVFFPNRKGFYMVGLGFIENFGLNKLADQDEQLSKQALHFVVGQIEVSILFFVVRSLSTFFAVTVKH